MPIIAFVLAKGFAMIAAEHEQGGIEQLPRAQSVDQLGKRGIAIVQRVQVMPKIITVRERAAAGRVVGMMARDGKVVDQELLARRQAINPIEDRRDGGGFIDAKTRSADSANIARVH